MPDPAQRADIEKVFKRHSRPQLPILPQKPLAIGLRSEPSWQNSQARAGTRKIHTAPPPKKLAEIPEETAEQAIEESAWVSFVRLGTLTQGPSKWFVCYRRGTRPGVYMFKEMGPDQASTRAISFRHLSFRHPSLIAPQFSIDSAAGRFLGFEYVRFSLWELVGTSFRIEDCHLQTITRSIFSALKYLHDHTMQHGHVGLASIRMCGQTGRILLGDCDRCTTRDGDPTNQDLEDLGLALLNCMDVEPATLRTAEQVREERATNQVFGLADAERWSGAKQLIDFLDDLFLLRRRPAAKFEKPHEYALGEPRAEECMRPLKEVAALECYTLWESDR